MRRIGKALKWAWWMLLRGLDYVLVGFFAGDRPATTDDANADYWMDGLFAGYRLGPERIPRPGSAAAPAIHAADRSPDRP